ncbi:MAG: hypothetical protein ABIP51_18640, partial [Bacteroidia bacterium]
MRIIIISSLSLITQVVSSQIQQQQLFNNTNVSNINIQSRGNLINDNNFSNIQKVKVQVKNILQPKPAVRNRTKVNQPRVYT